ncbi:MAG: hypothetical protein CM15mL4_1310 [uncultured marine virus]|nr:MAG: hypothetical protein CM15mL4_1310 [uncultured marine virus]
MPYIGRDLNQGNYLKLDDISSQFDGSKVSFDLKTGGTNFFPGSSMALMVVLGGVVQEAEAAYTIDQSSIEFASAPTSAQDCFIIVLGSSIGVSVPADASVTMPKLAQSAIDRLSSVGIQSGGTLIGAGVTFINFVQSGLTASVSSGVATVNLGGKTDEEIQDIIGAMVSGNTETNISVTYDDGNGKLNFVSDQLTTEEVQDIVGGMVSGNTETNITVTYDDSAGKLNFNVGGVGKFIESNSGIHTNTNIGIKTTGFPTEMVGAGNSFQGMYISNGMIVVDNKLNGNHYISTNFNGLMAGPVTVNGVLTVDGNYVVV